MCCAVELMLIAKTAHDDIKFTTSIGDLPIKSSSGFITTPPPSPTNAPKNVAAIIISP